MTSREIFEKLCEVTPGGVNSPFRSFREVGGLPPVIDRAEGFTLYDVDGKAYIDLCCAWGPVILGHNHPAIAEAVRHTLNQGAVFGASTVGELELARLVREAIPSMEQVRFVNSGAEAVASTLRVARGVTGRPRILKFEGGYHGHVECLDSSGQEARDLGGPLAMGASPGAAEETLVAEYNNLDSVKDLFRRHPGEIAAVILEPITGSMGVIVPPADFLYSVRDLCHENGSLLIFDEVLSGFRVAWGGAQALYAIQPDLTSLGKALAGGLPIGAYGGRRELMARVAPLGTIYQAGTFCGNPLSMSAGVACLKELRKPGLYARLATLTERLVLGLRAISPHLMVQSSTALFSVHIGPRPIHSHRDLDSIDHERFARLHRALLDNGVYFPPSCIDAACITVLHDEEVVDRVVAAFSKAWESA